MTPWRCFLTTFRQCCLNMTCAPLFLAAIAIYAAYYCWPYMAQLPEHIHTAIVDGDDSPLSRRIAMELRSSPKLDVLESTANRGEAILAMKAAKVSAIVEIPANFSRNVAAGIPAAITLTADGAYLVAAKMATSGVTGPLEAAAGKAIADWLAQQGASPAQMAGMKSQAPAVLIVPAYNTISGYLNFAVPIVFIAVFQTLMCAGFGMLFNTWFQANQRPAVFSAALASPLCMFCAQLPVFFLCFFWAMFIEGPVFYLQGANSFQNIGGTLAICAAFSFAISSFALFMGLLLGPTHFVMQGVVLSALPCVFISGNLWPAQNIPLLMRGLAWLFPSTPGSQGIMRASQCGASPEQVGPYMLHLLILAILYFLLARLLCHFHEKRGAMKTAAPLTGASEPPA